MKKYIPVYLILFLALTGRRGDSQCVDIGFTQMQACIQSVESSQMKISKLKKAEEGSLAALFYLYFEGTDYNGYKSLFLTKDWFDMTQEEFDEWRTFLEKSNIEMLGQIFMKSNGVELGIIKYTYDMDDYRIYETFLAKKVNSSWRPVSVDEEQQYLVLTNLVRFSRSDYLESIVSNVGQRKPFTDPIVKNGSIQPKMMTLMKDSLKVYHAGLYKEYYNDEFEYRSKDKYQEDRGHDATFRTFLNEMQVLGEYQDRVMSLIMAQDYLRAAALADEYSSVTYTYSPFVDKIREVYGRDRIKKWDSVTNQWN